MVFAHPVPLRSGIEVHSQIAKLEALGVRVLLARIGIDLLPLYAGSGVAVTVAISLYLFWTLERMMGAARIVRRAAAGCACASVALAFATDVIWASPAADAGVVPSGLDVTRWLFGEPSLAPWILAYSGIVLRSRKARARTAAVS